MCEGCTQEESAANGSAAGNQNHIRQYGWDWFRYHAEQRTSMFNYSIAAASLLAAGYVAAIDKHPNVAGSIAFLGAWITLSFVLIDGRNDKLVRRGERVLRALEVSDFPNVTQAPVKSAGHTMPGGILIVDEKGVRTNEEHGLFKQWGLRYRHGTHRLHLRLIQGTFCAAFLLGGSIATWWPERIQTKDPPVAENIKTLSDQVTRLSASLNAITDRVGNANPRQTGGDPHSASSSGPAPANLNDRH